MPEADIVIESPAGTLLPAGDVARAGAILSAWRATPVRLAGRSHGPGVVRWAIVGDTRQVEAELAIERALLAAGGSCSRSYPHTIRYIRLRPEGTVTGYGDNLTVGLPPGTPESTDVTDFREQVSAFADMIRYQMQLPGARDALSAATRDAFQHDATSLEARLLALLAGHPAPGGATPPASSAPRTPITSTQWLTGVLMEAYRLPAGAARSARLQRAAKEGPPVSARQFVLGGHEVGTAIVSADQLLRNSGEAVEPADLRRIARQFQQLWKELRRDGISGGPRPDRAARDSGGLPDDEDDPDHPI